MRCLCCVIRASQARLRSSEAFRYHRARRSTVGVCIATARLMAKHWQPWEQLGLSTRDSILVHQLADGTYRTFYKGVMASLPVV